MWSPTHNLVRRDSVLGWIDASHVMAEIDATTLAVVDAVTGAAATVAVSGADQVEMVGVAGWPRRLRLPVAVGSGEREHLVVQKPVRGEPCAAEGAVGGAVEETPARLLDNE